MTTVLTFKVEMQTDGAVDEKYVKRSLENAITHYRSAEGLSAPGDEGSVTEFQVSDLDTGVLIGGDDVLRRRLQALLEKVEDGCTLHHYAARDAIQTLAKSWLADDKVWRHDIETTINILREVNRELADQPSRALDDITAALAATERVQALNAMSFEAEPGALKDALEKALGEANSEMDSRQIALAKQIIREVPAAFDLNLIRNLDQGGASVGELEALKALAEVAPLSLADLETV